MEGKIVTANYPARAQFSHTNSGKFTTMCCLWWLISKPVTVKNATLYFHLLSWDFILFFIKIFAFIIFISFLDGVSNFYNRILLNQKSEYVS